MNYILIKNIGRKIICSLLTLVVLANEIITMPSVSAVVLKDPSLSNTAYAEDGQVPQADKPNAPATVYDLVAVVVDVGLDQDKNSYDGLKKYTEYQEFSNKLEDTQLGNRVLRYAEDVRKSSDLTDVKILFFDKSKDSVQDLAAALENLYRKGDAASSNKNRLAGVVLVGDIPLPVVNKNGNRYISMFPYTDFSDKAYQFNTKTKSFERNTGVSFPKPEIWHGVINAPGQDFNAREKLAEYFDKNHLYYEGVPMFAQFDRRMFFGDLVHEEEQINTDSYKNYTKYLASLEDLAYKRYNKFWANEMISQTTAVLKDIPEEIKPKGENAKFLDSIKNSNPLTAMPDIYSKSVIDQTLIPYYQVLSKYIGNVNDWAYNTARYDKSVAGKMNVDSVAGLIAIKDEYTKYYLKAVNDALEKKTNQIAEKIQEPIKLVDSSELSGEVEGKPFKIEIKEAGAEEGTFTDKLFYRFNYKNQQDEKWYVNGTDATILQSPKQCTPFLGSTKSEYFDENLAFNPRAVGGKYSVLTRSIRSDDGATFQNVHTTGVNTRMLSPISIGGQPSELYQATAKAYAGKANNDGTYNTGAIVEDNPAYGISAFIQNPLSGVQALQKGDVIVKVNGQDINFANTFDQAIENSYQAVKTVIDIVNDKNSSVKPSERLKNFPYIIKLLSGENLDQGNASQIAGYFSLEFYRGGKVQKQYFSFTVDKNGLTNSLDPQGDPEVYVLLDTPPGVDFNNGETYETSSEGAIFTLYNNKVNDPSAGCNANSTSSNSDRCLGIMATMPVLDPAGSMAPILLKFPEKFNVDADKHVDSYQFPGGGKNDYYKYEDVDEVYMNSCFNGLPAANKDDVTDKIFENDLYGKLLKSLSLFLNGSLADDVDYVDGDSIEQSSTYNPRESTWQGLDKIDASEVVLNDDPQVTLKDFSDRYGLFDGIDNDGDNKDGQGITDYKWVDGDPNANPPIDPDGVYDHKYYDPDEADVKYAIPSWDMPQIARKLLARDGSYTIKKFDKDVTLNVKANNFKKLSSLILHNEPTDYTITQQLKAQTTFSLPIDNPRYIAFQNEPTKGQNYPDDKNKPINAAINVEAIKKTIGDAALKAPLLTGKTQKIKYVNLFDEEIRNMAQLQAALITKATELALVPGSYRIFGAEAEAGDFTPKQISDEMLNNYLLPVVKNTVDSPVQGFDLNKAAEPKIYDALNWLNLNIDEKHQYILQYYLNGDYKNQGNAYVADHTLLPAPDGINAEFGYEAAYLVLKGEENSFDINFNRDLPEEKNSAFDPLAQVSNGLGAEEGGVGEGEEDVGGGDSEEEDSYEFVWLQDFIKELQKFMKALSTVPKFTNECLAIVASQFDDKGKAGDPGEVAVKNDNESGGSDQNVPDPDANTVEINSYVYNEIVGYDNLLKAIEAKRRGAEDKGSDAGAGAEARAGSDASVDAGVGSVSGSVSDAGVDAGAGGGNGSSNGVGSTDGNGNGNGNAGKNGTGGVLGTKTGALEKALSDINKTADKTGSGGGSGGDESGSGGEAGAGELNHGNDQNKTGEKNKTDDVNNNGDGQPARDQDKDLVILKSTKVKEQEFETIRSTPVENDKVETNKKVPREVQKKKDAVTPPVEKKWEEYFIGAKYYKKFLPKDAQPRSETHSKRWLAEAFSDNPFKEAEKKEESKYQVMTGNTLTADDTSIMKIEAVIYDKTGKVEIKQKPNVKFSLSSNLASFVGDNVVVSSGGSAGVYVKAGKKVGDFTIKAEVLKENGKVDVTYQVVTKDLQLVAGEPESIAIQSDADVLVANNQSNIILDFILRDKFGNAANNAFDKIAVFVNDKAKFDPGIDVNSQLIGTQLDTLDGKASVQLFAGSEPGDADVVAVILEPDLEDKILKAGNNTEGIDFSKYIGATKSFKILDKVGLSLQIYDENFQPVNSVIADGKSIVRLGVKLMDNGQVLKNYNGEIKFTVLKPNIGNFANKPPRNLVNGELNSANVTFKVGKLTGEEEILVEVPGFVSDSFKFKVKSDVAKSIQLNAIQLNASETELTAKLLDASGNLVKDDNGTVINFGATVATDKLVSFSQNKAETKNGVATVQVSGKNISGTANIIAQTGDAKSGAKNFANGTISLKINKHMDSNVVKNFSPRALYVSLLGGNFGKPGVDNNLSNSILYSKGQVQSLSAVTATKDEKKRLFGVDGYGKIDFMSEVVFGKVIAATSSFPYQKVSIADDISGDELANVFLVPKVDAPVVLLDDKTEVPEKEGVFVKVLDEGSVPLFSQENDGVYLQIESDTKVKVDKYGRISINDDGYQLRVPNKDDETKVANFAFILSKGSSDIALISFKQNVGQAVSILDFGAKAQNLTAGIYIEPLTDKNKYNFVSSFSGSSSAEPKGLYMVDDEEKIEGSQAPGFGYSSLENAAEDSGVGFEGSNKHMLLFAAGNSVGDSFIPYAADSGIIYGDPTIKLKVDTGADSKNELVSKDTFFSKDVGKAIFNGAEPIQQLIEFDANGDGYDDLLLVYEDGLIRLLENEISNKKFRDRGYVLNIYNGIYSITKIDVNNDGYDDLVVGTKKSCNVGEQCVSLIKNNNGSFDREPLNLALEDKKIYEMKAADMNADGCEDLVTSDSAGSISIFYNKSDGESCLGLETNHGYSRNFGFNLNSELNQVDNLFINYPGMELPDNGKSPKSNWSKFINFTLAGDQAPAQNPQYIKDASELQNLIQNSDQIATKDVPIQTFDQQFNFIHIKQDGKFALNSSKQGKDLNGGSVGVEDEIEYLIVLKNDSGNTVKNLMLSDVTPTSMTLLKDTLRCLDAGCPDKLEWLDTGTSLRSGIIKNISVPAGGQRIISYKMIVNLVPKIHFELGNNFVQYTANKDDPSNNDLYGDIMIRPEVNPDGIITYLYSVESEKYEKFETTPADNSSNAVDDTFAKLGLPSPSEIIAASAKGEVSPEMAAMLKKFAASQNQDKDYNGCADKWSDILITAQSSGEALATGIENTLSNLRCSGGGCLPIPYNYALLAQDGAIPGLPAVSIVPYPPYVLPFAPSIGTNSFFRFYISPTTTLGLGGAACAGPNGVGGCFAFSVPGGIPGVCAAVKQAVHGVISAASKAVVNVETGQSAAIIDGQGAGGAKGVDTGGSWGNARDPISATSKVNVKVPGFPSVVTNWLDGEIDEIYTKLLRFPTFYFVLPDFSRVGQESKLAAQQFSFRGFNDFATSLSNFPFVKLEGKEIIIKIPAISPKEIAKYKYQADAWIKHMESELQKYKLWDCEKNENRQTFCDAITVDMQTLINSVRKFMDALDKIANLPKDILHWRNVEAKYATQIICYLDAIMQYTGGYINRQQKIVESWTKAIRDTIRTFKQWKIIMDTVTEYQQSCDKCKNDRFSKLGLLLQLFAVIPDIPIIPLPKLPDVVVDFSQIKTGVTIIWPDVVFRPEPIILPNLPDINLPDVLPVDLNFDLDALTGGKLDFQIDIPKFPDFSLPNLPDLPQIPLPQLPDLPKPPKIPALPNFVGKFMTNLKFIFKILCLLKNGQLFIPETLLETEIETMTQPNVQVVLPIVKNLGVQFPPIEYSYVDQIRINGKLNFTIDTNFIYVAADKGAKIWNDGVAGFIGNINKYTSLPYGQIVNKYIQTLIDKAQNGVQKKLDKPLSFENIQMENFQMENIRVEMNQYVAELEKNKGPDTYNLVATQKFIDSSNPLLNRSLAEIENAIKYENLPNSSGLLQMAALRDQMIAYTKGLKATDGVLKEIDDYNEFGKILVDNNSQRVDLIAANPSANDVTGSNVGEVGKTLAFSFLGKEVESAIKQAAENADLSGKRDLIAAAINFSPQDIVDNANAPTPPPIGFYVSAGTVSENVLNYTKELKGKTNILFSDVDHDQDYDIVYSTGGDIYLKTNYNPANNLKLPEGELIIGLTNNAVGDFVNKGGIAVDGLAVPAISTGKFDISWLPVEGAVSYEIVLRKSIYDDIENAAYNFKVIVSALSDKNSPRISENVPNGNYYVNVFAVNSNDEKSLISDTVIAAPQSCADNESPMPVINSTEYTISIFQNLEIDAGGSFDPDGKIEQYYLERMPYESSQSDPNTGDKLKITPMPKILGSDVTVLIDEDGDGFPFNDKTNSHFNIGPFENEGDIGDHKFLLHVVDASGKNSSIEITIHVIAPAISLDESFAATGEATGTTEPKTPELPFWLMRSRYISRVINGQLKLVPRIDKLKEAFTEAGGGYFIRDLILDDMILVENADGEVVAEINPKTGNIGAIEDGYKAVINEAIPPNTPTNLEIKDKNDQVLGTIYMVADANSDVNIYQNFGFVAENMGDLKGVNIDDLDKSDDFIFEKLPANDADNPGGAVLKNVAENKVLASVDSSGNVVIFDKRLTIAQKINDHANDPLIINVNFAGKTVGEIYVALLKPATIIGANDVPQMSPRKPSAGVLNGSLAISKGPDAANYVIDPSFKFTQEDLVKRKDFVKVLLKMICVIPREEAYKAFVSGSGYTDNALLGDYHPDIKEATLLQFIDGYKGEKNDSGLSPFKPENNITRAEAIKIILKALEYRGIIDMSSLKEGDPWYGDYLQAARNLTPYLKSGKPIKNNFVITEEEAKNPAKLMNFGELLVMVQRVLDIYNCFEQDTNNDGLTDYCAAKYKITDAKADPDQDGLSNSQECTNNLNPLDADSDQGGVKDGKEIAMHTNPLDPVDDAIDEDQDGLSNYEETNIYHTDPYNPDTDGGSKNDGKEVEDCGDPLNQKDDDKLNSCKNQSVPGLYLVPAECNACPCISTFTHKADLIPGDVFFPVVAKYYPQYYEIKPNDKTYIFTKGNEVQIQTITK